MTALTVVQRDFIIATLNEHATDVEELAAELDRDSLRTEAVEIRRHAGLVAQLDVRIMSKPSKITEAQARWLRSVKAGDITLYFPWGGGNSTYQDGSNKARDRGVLKRLRADRLIQDEGTVTGRRRPHPITLTTDGHEALEAHDS